MHWLAIALWGLHPFQERFWRAKGKSSAEMVVISNQAEGQHGKVQMWACLTLVVGCLASQGKCGEESLYWHGIGRDQQGSLNHKGLSLFSSPISIWCCKEEGTVRRLTWSKQRIRQVIQGVEHCLDVKIHFSKAKEKKDDCSNWEESQAVLKYLKE